MEVKLFEVRDSGTFIPMLAIKLHPRNEAERFLLSRAGFGAAAYEHEKYVLLAGLNGGTDKITFDSYEWGDRTRQTAHKHIIENFDTLRSGTVIDVEYILGETDTLKVTEALE